jgi:hypothetical protein
MHLSEEQLKMVEEMSYRLFPPVMIAINIEADELDFTEAINTPGEMARNAYYKGLIRQQMELRDSIIKAAKNGSNPAQQQIIHLSNTLISQLNG